MILDLQIKVRVKPGSKKQEVIKVNDSEFIVYLKERAEKGKANEALVKIFSRKFKINSKKITLKNSKSRVKVIKIEDK